MVKCSVVGCDAPVVGGFQEVIDASSFDDPGATLDGMKRAWCAEHERSLKRNLPRGRFLTRAELKSTP